MTTRPNHRAARLGCDRADLAGALVLCGAWVLGACSAHDSSPGGEGAGSTAASSSGAPSVSGAVESGGAAGSVVGANAGMSSGVGADDASVTGSMDSAPEGGAPGTEGGTVDEAAVDDEGAVDSAAEVGTPCNVSPGTALQFEGQTPDLVQATIANLPVGAASRTIELWAYFDGSPSSWVNEHGLFETGDMNGDATYPTMGCHEFGLNSTAWGSDQPLAMLHPYGNCNSIDNFFNIPAGTFSAQKSGWVHISFGYDMAANNFQFTINGNAMLAIGTGDGAAGRTHPESTWPAQGWDTTSYPASQGGNLLSIGTTPQFRGPTGWQGKIDEFRVWSVFRTAAEIQANMRVMLRGTEPGLVAYYKFDEGSGMTAADATGDPTHMAKMVPINGQLTPPKWVTSDIPGPFTCAP
jgi:hypothetical protein